MNTEINKDLYAACELALRELTMDHPGTTKEEVITKLRFAMAKAQGVNPEEQIIGFQVVSKKGDPDIHPAMDGSFCVYSKSQCEEMIKNGPAPRVWKIEPIHWDSIEEPTLMFTGPCRNADC